MKVLINRCWGGFGLSRAVAEHLGVKCADDEHFYKADYDIAEALGLDIYGFALRTDPRIIAAVEAVGIENASSRMGKVTIVEIPDGIQWEIDNYDGMETIEEVHRSWS